MSKQVAKRTIVIAWTVEDVVKVGPDRGSDLGRRPVIERGAAARTVLWLAAGTDEDVARANAYAATQESFRGPARVYTYPTTERSPREKAAAAILRA